MEKLKKLFKYLEPTDNGLYVKGALKSPNFVRNLKGWGVNISNQGDAFFKTITAGTYIKVFVQDTVPTSENINDIWYDSNDDYKQYYAVIVGATTVVAGQWVEANYPTEWANVADGASTKPDNNADVTGDNEADISLANLGEKSFASLTAGTITSKAITLAVSAGTGDVYIKSSGKTDFWATKILGDSSTRFDVAGQAGTTIRYTYDENGTDPEIETYIHTGDIVAIILQNGSADNNGIFTVTGTGTNYFEIDNASGGDESDVLIGTGKLEVGQTGFILGIDDSDSDKSKLFIGNYNKYLNWDGDTCYIKGSLQTEDFNWMTLFESIDGYQTGGTGTEVIAASVIGVSLQTGATINNTAYIRKYFNAVPYFTTWDKNRTLRCVVNFTDNADQLIWMVWGDATTSERKIGFYVDGAHLNAIVANGTNNITIELITTLSTGTDYVLEAKFYAGDRCEFFINGSFINQTSTYLPSGTSDAEKLMENEILTEASAAKKIVISLWEVWQEY